MKSITHKLRSNGGASLMLALVFLMFCVFVGGSVLAAAAANSYRVVHLADQQTYLDQRSAAMLIADELDPASSNVNIRLTIVDVTQTIEPVNIDNGGLVTKTPANDTIKKHVITAMLPAGLKMTAMQRLAVETALWQYLDAHTTAGSNYDLTLSNFVYNDGSGDTPINSIDQFWFKHTLHSSEPFSGTVNIKGTSSGSNFTSFEAYFTSLSGSDMYDFLVNFGEDSQVHVEMNASYQTKTPVSFTESPAAYPESSTKYAEISSVSTQTAIIWADPAIQKGGA